MSSGIITIIWVVCIQIAAWGVGRPLYRLFTRNGNVRPETGLEAVFSAALGFIVLAYLAFGLAALGLLYPRVLIVITIVCALGGLVQLTRLTVPAWRISWLHDAPLVAAVLFAVGHIIKALFPILEHDDNVYHVLIPRLYLENHALVRLPTLLFANMPHGIEALYTAPMAIGDFTAPKMFAFFFTFWIIAGLVACARPVLGRFGSGLAPLVYLSGQNVQWHLGPAYIEQVLGFFLLCGCLAFLEWRRTRNRGLLGIAACTCGFAMASKYTAWLFVGVIYLVMGFELLRSRDAGPLRRRFWKFAGLAGIPLALMVPWLIKNTLFTGNPVYPNLYSLFDGACWSEVQQMQYLREVDVAGGLNKTVLDYLMLPWRLITEDKLFICPCFSMSLMALWLVALVFPASYRRPQWPVLAISVLGFIVWAFSMQQGRFLVAWVPVMTLAAVFALAPLRDSLKPLAAVFCAIIALGVYQGIAHPIPYARYTDIFFSSRSELEHYNYNYVLCGMLNKVVPEDGKVLGLWENRFFFLQRTCNVDSIYQAPTGLARLRALGNAEAFARELVASGFTHVVINRDPAARYMKNSFEYSVLDERLYPASRLDEDRWLMTNFVDGYLEPLDAIRGVAAYRIRAERIVGRDTQL